MLGAIGIMNKSKLGATIGSGVGAVGGGAVGKEIVDATVKMKLLHITILVLKVLEKWNQKLMAIYLVI